MGKNSDTRDKNKACNFPILSSKKNIVKKKELKKLNSEKEGRIKINKTNTGSSLHKRFKCETCSIKFTSHKKFIQHLREHGDIRKRNGKSTQCDTCSMVFSNQTKAIQHKHRAHPNVPNSFCQFCGKLFVLKNSLEEHLTKDHPNQKPQAPSPIKCDYCSATFSNTVALQYHVKSLHQQINYLLANDLYIPPSSTKIMRSNSSELFSAYYCHLCGVEYMIKNSLKKHLYEMHSLEERNMNPDDIIKCRTCEAIFFKKMAYAKHLVFHKPNDFYAPNQEARMKVVSRVDQDFDISRVPLLQEINIMLKQMAENNVLPSSSQEKIQTQENPIEVTDVKELNNGSQFSFQKKNLSSFSNEGKQNVALLENEKIYLEDEKMSTDVQKIQTEKSEENKVSLTKCPSLNKSLPIIDANPNSKKLNETLKPTTSGCKNSENKIIIKSKTDATMEIVDAQNKVILLKKVTLKKKPKVKLQIENN